MDYVNLGRSGLKVSRLCLGTMNFGAEATLLESLKIMNLAADRGINFVDTANVYGNKPYEGWTEQIVGRWLADGAHRDRVVLATKCYGPIGPGVNERGLSALNIRRSCEASLRRLGTDRIDLYQMHHVDRSVGWEEIWRAMEDLVRAGKVLYVGSSNFAGWHIADAQAAAERGCFPGLVSEQTRYSLACRTPELEVLPSCRHHGLGLLPYSPLEGGILGGVLGGGDQGARRRSERSRERIGQLRPRIEQYEAFCSELGHEPAQVALAWLMADPAVTAPIVGPRTDRQLEALLGAAEVRLNEAALARLDEIWPGPGGPAPEAYAW